MKKLIVTFVCLFCLTAAVFAGENDQVSPQMGKTRGGVDLNFPEFYNNSSPAPAKSSNLLVKIWFTDAQGNPYNPTTHIFKPKERFDIWICSNSRIAVALFQNYQKDRPDSRLVFPVKDNPVTYQPLKAFVPVKIPISFEMDDDMRDEFLSIVACKGDQNGSVTTVVDAAINNIATGNSQSVIVNGNNNFVILYQDSTNYLLRFNNRMLESQNETMRFTPSSGTSVYVDTPAPTGATYTEKEYGKDVCCTLSTQSAIAQYQLTLHKK